MYGKAFYSGDIVRFGRPNGEKTLARVVKVNRKTIYVTTLERRGNKPAGTGWRVPPSMAEFASDAEVEAAGVDASAPMSITEQRAAVPTAGYNFYKGQRVVFEAYYGRKVTGTVRRVNRKTVTVDPDSPSHYGQYWRVAPSKLKAV